MRKINVLYFFYSFFILVIPISIFGNLVFNNTHLERLSQYFVLNGEVVKGYWVYADNKGEHFEVTTALNEGDFCVDDVARVVLLYTEAYEITKDFKYLNLALEASKFVLQMQTADGEFYNFAWHDGTVNKHGITSQKSSSWWTLRAFVGLSKLSQYSKDERLLNAIKKTYSALKRTPPVYGDQLGLYVLGLSYYVTVTNDDSVKKDLRKYADELLNYEWKSFSYLKGFFSVYQDTFSWNGWGNHYSEALVEAYRVLNDSRYLNAAQSSLESQAPMLLSTGLIYSIGKHVKLYPELAYALECLVVPTVKLYQITKNEKYAYFALLLTSWLYGGNRLGIRMLGKNGEGFDGLEFMHYNRNAGAESTICALRTVLYAMTLPEKFGLIAEKVEILGRNGIIVLEAESFDPGLSSVRLITGDFGGGAKLKTDGKSRLRKELLIADSDNYAVLIAGDFRNTTVTISSKNQLKKELSGSGIFEIGEVEIQDFITVSLSNSCEIDQIILIPEKIGLSFRLESEEKSVVYNFKEKEAKLIDGKIFAKKDTKLITSASVSLKSVGEFFLLDLSTLFNNDGFATPQKPGNFDNLGGVVGAYFPGNELRDGINYVKGVPFEIVINGNDNIRCDSQVLVLESPIKCEKIYILSAANHGDYKAEFLVNSKPYVLTIRDWCVNPTDIVFDYRYIQSGERQSIKCGITIYELDISDLGEPIREIILPKEINVHIFAISVK
ncbi:hypothetical protein [Fervidobacterium sp.]